MRLPIAFACAMALAAPALAQTPVPAACKAGLDRIAAGTEFAQARLKTVSNLRSAETCNAARRHFIEMVNARAVAASCRTGAARTLELQKLDAAVEDLNGVIADTCG